MKSNKAAFVVVSLITIILLVGSAILQRIVFKAAESHSSVYLSPTNFLIKPGGTVELSVISDFPIRAFVAGAQVVISYPNNLEYLSSQAGSGFEAKKTLEQNGKFHWALLPAPSQGLVGEYQGSTLIGKVTFQAKTSGSVSINIDPQETFISAIDPDGSTALYNAATTVQGTTGEITDLASATQVSEKIADNIEKTISSFLTQRIISSELIALNDRAVLALGLRDSARVRVDFGSTESLGNSVTTTTAAATAVVKLQSLQEQTRYYYQINLIDENDNVVASYPQKTFTTGKMSSGEIDISKSQLYILSAGSKATVLGLLRDSNGDIIEERAELTVVDGEASVTTLQPNGLIEGTVSLLTGSRQTVKVAMSANQKVIATTAAVMEPATDTDTLTNTSTDYRLPLNQRTYIMIAALLLILLSSGLVLARFHRVQS